jgi:hypothetical protein
LSGTHVVMMGLCVGVWVLGGVLLGCKGAWLRRARGTELIEIPLSHLWGRKGAGQNGCCRV